MSSKVAEQLDEYLADSLPMEPMLECLRGFLKTDPRLSEDGNRKLQDINVGILYYIGAKSIIYAMSAEGFEGEHFSSAKKAYGLAMLCAGKKIGDGVLSQLDERMKRVEGNQ